MNFIKVSVEKTLQTLKVKENSINSEILSISKKIELLNNELSQIKDNINQCQIFLGENNESNLQKNV
jgi:hypothetical protein